ncbi:hypothetical protein JTB14_023573 [Gonioctena quinquepunctata]|nr:hypothetical protein JTB14_023573 [Gonioctena quinquepunctata]
MCSTIGEKQKQLKNQKINRRKLSNINEIPSVQLEIVENNDKSNVIIQKNSKATSSRRQGLLEVLNQMTCFKVRNTVYGPESTGPCVSKSTTAPRGYANVREPPPGIVRTPREPPQSIPPHHSLPQEDFQCECLCCPIHRARGE